jgi:putative spermidine/putrescine transport system permease protein
MTTLALAADPLRDRARLAVSLLALPPAVFLTLAFATPIAVVLMLAVRGEQGLTFAHLANFFASPVSRTMIVNTVVYGIGTGALCCALGFPLGYAIARAGRRLQVLLIVLTFLPLCTSVIIKAFAITILLKSNGIVNATMLWLGIIDAPVRLIFTEVALFAGSFNVFLPFAVLPVFAVLAERGRDLEDAAATLGCRPSFTLFRIVLPLARPGLLAGFSIVAAQAMSAYVVPTLLIGDRFKVLSRGAYDAFVLHNAVGAAVAALVLLLLALTVVGIAHHLGGRKAATA